MSHKLPRSFRIAPELRRSCVYGICGVVVVCVVAWLVAIDRERAIWLCAIFSAVGLGLLIPLHWQLQVDESGIERRRVFWRDFWSWGGFASGRIEKRHPIVLVDPMRPWWRRRLNLGYVGEEALKELLPIVNTRYVMPPPPELPDVLELRIGFTRLLLDAHGVQWDSLGGIRRYHWSEVQRVHITRVDPKRRDFHTLVFELPHGEVKLEVRMTKGGPVDGWRGASAEVITEFLHAHLPDERIDVDVRGERPARREDAERQLKEAKGKSRAIVWCAVGLTALLVCMIPVFVAFDGFLPGLIKGTAMTAIYLIVYGPILWFFRREWQQKILRLEELLDGFGPPSAMNKWGAS